MIPRKSVILAVISSSRSRSDGGGSEVPKSRDDDSV